MHIAVDLRTPADASNESSDSVTRLPPSTCMIRHGLSGHMATVDL